MATLHTEDWMGMLGDAVEDVAGAWHDEVDRNVEEEEYYERKDYARESEQIKYRAEQELQMLKDESANYRTNVEAQADVVGYFEDNRDKGYGGTGTGGIEFNLEQHDALQARVSGWEKQVKGLKEDSPEAATMKANIAKGNALLNDMLMASKKQSSGGRQKNPYGKHFVDKDPVNPYSAPAGTEAPGAKPGAKPGATGLNQQGADVANNFLKTHSAPDASAPVPAPAPDASAPGEVAEDRGGAIGNALKIASTVAGTPIMGPAAAQVPGLLKKAFTRDEMGDTPVDKVASSAWNKATGLWDRLTKTEGINPAEEIAKGVGGAAEKVAAGIPKVAKVVKDVGSKGLELSEKVIAKANEAGVNIREVGIEYANAAIANDAKRIGVVGAKLTELEKKLNKEELEQVAQYMYNLASDVSKAESKMFSASSLPKADEKEKLFRADPIVEERGAIARASGVVPPAAKANPSMADAVVPPVEGKSRVSATYPVEGPVKASGVFAEKLGALGKVAAAPLPDLDFPVWAEENPVLAEEPGALGRVAAASDAGNHGRVSADYPVEGRAAAAPDAVVKAVQGKSFVKDPKVTSLPANVQGATQQFRKSENFAGALTEKDLNPKDAVAKHEAFKLKGFVPKWDNGDVMDNSGVEIAAGFDFGQHNEKSLTEMGMPPYLIKKFSPYFGLQRDEAVAKLKEIPVDISRPEAALIHKLALKFYISKTQKRFDKDSNLEWSSLSQNKKDVIMEIVYQFGAGGTAKMDFWQQVTKGQWPAAVKNLETWGGKYSDRMKDHAKTMKG